MNEGIKAAIEEYQCPGCVCGSGIECYEKGLMEECGKHVAGTMSPGIGPFMLGMPTGFNRVGDFENFKLQMFNSYSDGWTDFCKFNVPVWKHLNEKGHTLVRGLSPRINQPFLHIYLEDCMVEIDCLEITNADIAEMD